MATMFVATANNLFLPSIPSTASSNHKRQILCKATPNEPSSSGDSNPPPSSFLTSSRRGISVNLIAATTLLLGGGLEAIALDPEKLLDKVKEDRKQKIADMGIIEPTADEKEILKNCITNLKKVDDALNKNDISTASSVLGAGIDALWFQQVNFALNQLTATGDEAKEVDNFNINMTNLVTAVQRGDLPASKVALDASASALKTWTNLTGIAKELKGI